MNVNQPGAPSQKLTIEQSHDRQAEKTTSTPHNSPVSSASGGHRLAAADQSATTTLVRSQQQLLAKQDATKDQKMRESVLRHQQQRLLLLRHAAKCKTPESRLCPVTPHCSGMKRLWRHISVCKDTKCLTPHCVSSRYVLTHYHRCQYLSCEVCQPVRLAIHKSHRLGQKSHAASMRRSSVSHPGSGSAPVNGSVSMNVASQPRSESPNSLRQAMVSRVLRLASKQLNTRGSVQVQSSATELAQHIEADLFNSRAFKDYLQIKDSELEDLISDYALQFNLGRLKLG